MRVKLSYTVEEEDILKEAAKILGLSSDDMGHAIEMFKTVQAELRGDEEQPNTGKVLDMIDDFRKALLAVDTRLIEVEDIVKGYDKYRIDQRSEGEPPALESERYYGAD
jgi:hypothetical protein